MASSRAADEGTLLKAILQESATEVMVFGADTLRIAQANPAAAKNLQHQPRALKKLTPLDFLPPEDRQAFHALLTLLRHGKKRRTALSVHCRRRDGTLYPVEVRMLYSADHEKPVFIWIANDVSQREATRQALAHSVSDLHAIVAHIPGMAFQIQRRHDARPSLRYVSEQSAQLLGIKASALLGKPERFYKLILEEDRPGYLARLEHADGGHMTFNWEGRIRMKAWKDVKWVAIRVSQRQDENGTIWDGIMLNMTHSKEAEAELLRSRAQLSALAAHVESVKEQERLHLAREVHDDLGGNLTTIKIGLSWLMRHLPPEQPLLIERTAYLDNVVDQTFEAAHRIASNLRPAALDFGIVPAIAWQLQRFTRNTDIPHEFSASEDTIPLDPDAEIAAFRIVQEALTNVARHARASRVKLRLVREPDSLRITLTDNGRGLQPAPENGHGFGILGMIERAAALGGALTVQPARRQGTQVSLRIPLAAPLPDPAE
ncbi:MAG: sensor protein [Thiobacillus sp. 63-78]|uniref:PAS domain-containing sensor histidine kinase n=1 Tax=Thiobacillus sp. 63-78 TaxID=1895859 RepID=UPI0009594F82|nr:PAS domain S-box protein [Thiobacillus sp. 63-78]MBN8764564.1 PAS domain S-box protein [Thiobacillus sp.]MBN8774304.1 PAS domain S-box protein [Thiobacillus sp.]OJZ16247.1 MAG: sensor protein [Thiobacillus sp. 63-78]